LSMRILLADDHRMFREALCGLLAGEPDIVIAGEVGCGEDVPNALARLQADVLVLDISLPDRNGIEVARQVHRLFPKVRIVALTGHAEKVFVEEMLKAGAMAYVLKSAGLDELLGALRAVAVGHKFLSTEVLDTMLDTIQPDAPCETPPLSLLTPREQEILHFLASGRRGTDIAQSLDISAATVEVHRRNIKGKLGLRTTAELTRYAIRVGLISA